MRRLQRVRSKLLSVILLPILVCISAGAAAETYYFHNDQLGTPQVVTDNAQQVVWKGEYDPFGKVTETVALVEQNIRFPGQYFDSGTQMHYNYFRTYDPTTGRYVESDPIGLVDGVNTYGYVHSNPLSYIDSNGEAATLVTGAVGAIGGGMIGGIMSYMGGGSFSQGAINGAIAGGVAGLTLGLGGAAIAGSLGGGVAGGIAAGTTASVAGNFASQAYGLVTDQQCSFNYSSLASSAILGATFGGYALRPYTAPQQSVTTWAPNGVTPSFGSGTWVMTGQATPRNWIQTGRAPMYPYGNSATTTVSSKNIVWPKGIESIKGQLGQRRIR